MRQVGRVTTMTAGSESLSNKQGSAVGKQGCSPRKWRAQVIKMLQVTEVTLTWEEVKQS